MSRRAAGAELQGRKLLSLCTCAVSVGSTGDCGERVLTFVDVWRRDDADRRVSRPVDCALVDDSAVPPTKAPHPSSLFAEDHFADSDTLYDLPTILTTDTRIFTRPFLLSSNLLLLPPLTLASFSVSSLPAFPPAFPTLLFSPLSCGAASSSRSSLPHSLPFLPARAGALCVPHPSYDSRARLACERDRVARPTGGRALHWCHVTGAAEPFLGGVTADGPVFAVLRMASHSSALFHGMTSLGLLRREAFLQPRAYASARAHLASFMRFRHCLASFLSYRSFFRSFILLHLLPKTPALTSYITERPNTCFWRDTKRNGLQDDAVKTLGGLIRGAPRFIFILLPFPIQPLSLRYSASLPSLSLSYPLSSAHPPISGRVPRPPSRFSRSSVGTIPSAPLIRVLDLHVVLPLGGDRAGEAGRGSVFAPALEPLVNFFFFAIFSFFCGESTLFAPRSWS
ncbi:hypothetical protein C8J57DRAFT_1509152 [Mycena rebaudengoi]|nr:hypothetical protein C8J57DRAFT_1509152 [Mycena rebaudengoi]